MAPVSNTRVIFKSWLPASNLVEPGTTLVYDTSSVIDVEHAQLNGGILLKTLVLSLDIYMNGMMREGTYFKYVGVWPRLNRETHLMNKLSLTSLANRKHFLHANKNVPLIMAIQHSGLWNWCRPSLRVHRDTAWRPLIRPILGYAIKV